VLAQLSTIKKALVSALGMILAVLVFFNDNLGSFIPVQYRGIIIAIIAVLTPVATWLAKNEPAV
jgi:hypothetical protein